MHPLLRRHAAVAASATAGAAPARPLGSEATLPFRLRSVSGWQAFGGGLLLVLMAQPTMGLFRLLRV